MFDGTNHRDSLAGEYMRGSQKLCKDITKRDTPDADQGFRAGPWSRTHIGRMRVKLVRYTNAWVFASVTAQCNDWVVFFLAEAREGTNAEVAADSPQLLLYERVCSMAKVLVALPTRANDAATDGRRVATHAPDRCLPCRSVAAGHDQKGVPASLQCQS